MENQMTKLNRTIKTIYKSIILIENEQQKLHEVDLQFIGGSNKDFQEKLKDSIIFYNALLREKVMNMDQFIANHSQKHNSLSDDELPDILNSLKTFFKHTSTQETIDEWYDFDFQNFKNTNLLTTRMKDFSSQNLSKINNNTHKVRSENELKSLEKFSKNNTMKILGVLNGKSHFDIDNLKTTEVDTKEDRKENEGTGEKLGKSYSKEIF